MHDLHLCFLFFYEKILGFWEKPSVFLNLWGFYKFKKTLCLTMKSAEICETWQLYWCCNHDEIMKSLAKREITEKQVLHNENASL